MFEGNKEKTNRETRHKIRQEDKGQAAETVRTRWQAEWTAGRGCNEISRRPADRDRRPDRQAGRDLERWWKLESKFLQCEKTELCLQFWNHLCDAQRANCTCNYPLWENARISIRFFMTALNGSALERSASIGLIPTQSNFHWGWGLTASWAYHNTLVICLWFNWSSQTQTHMIFHTRWPVWAVNALPSLLWIR